MNQTFESVWDALEDDPVARKNFKLRSTLLIEINAELDNREINQTEMAELLDISQPRVSGLRNGKIDLFRIDSLVNFAHILGLTVSLNVAA